MEPACQSSYQTFLFVQGVGHAHVAQHLPADGLLPGACVHFRGQEAVRGAEVGAGAQHTGTVDHHMILVLMVMDRIVAAEDTEAEVVEEEAARRIVNGRVRVPLFEEEIGHHHLEDVHRATNEEGQVDGVAHAPVLTLCGLVAVGLYLVQEAGAGQGADDHTRILHTPEAGLEVQVGTEGAPKVIFEIASLDLHLASSLFSITDLSFVFFLQCQPIFAHLYVQLVVSNH